MKISWTVQSVDSVHRTAVVTYLCGDHRIALNISILSPLTAERDIIPTVRTNDSDVNRH